MDKETRIGFVGAGMVGTALAVALHAAGYAVVAVASRSRASAERLAGQISGCRALADSQAVADAADLVFITTPDDAVTTVAGGVRWRTGQTVVHCSGALGAEALAAAKAQGAQVGAFHPLQTFAGGKAGADALRGITFAVESEPLLQDTLVALARSLGGRCVALQPEDRALYHAAATFASNYAITLASLATGLLERCRTPQDGASTAGATPRLPKGSGQALRALMPLLWGTVRNLDTQGLPQALTGPIARGDVGTLRKHIAALESRAPEVVSAYCTLALETISIALAKGTLSPARAQEVRALLGQTTAYKTTESGIAAFDGGKKGMRTVLKSKVHRATVTEANIGYEGSISLDLDLMEAADILPYEKVWVLDVDNGARLTTYAIEGDRGSGTVCVNGAAARLVHKGDTVIVLTYEMVEEEKARTARPRLVYVDRMNRVTHTKNVDDR